MDTFDTRGAVVPGAVLGGVLGGVVAGGSFDLQGFGVVVFDPI